MAALQVVPLWPGWALVYLALTASPVGAGERRTVNGRLDSLRLLARLVRQEETGVGTTTLKKRNCLDSNLLPGCWPSCCGWAGALVQRQAAVSCCRRAVGDPATDRQDTGRHIMHGSMQPPGQSMQ